VSNNITPAAPGIIEENLVSADDLVLAVEHVLLDGVQSGDLRSPEEVAFQRDALRGIYAAFDYRHVIAAKAKQLREYMNAK